MQLLLKKILHILIICNIYVPLWKISKTMLKNGKQERTVIHLEKDGLHYYYGNLKALFDNWSRDALGVSYNYLKNYGLSSDNPYNGKNCIIRKGTIITSTRKMPVES